MLRERANSIVGRAELYSTEIKTTVFGNNLMTFASHPFSEAMTNEELIEKALLHQGFDQKEIERRIDQTGFLNRFVHNSIDINSQKEISSLHEEMVEIGALLLQKTIDERGVPKFVKFGSGMLADLSERIIAKANMDPASIPHKDYHTFCADWVVMMIDTLADPALKNQEGVFINLNPLSALMHDSHFGPDRLEVAAIFGEGHVATGFNTKDFRLISANISFVPDGGVIKARTFYDKPRPVNTDIPDYLHEYIQFIDNAGEKATESVEISQKGIKIRSISPNDPKLGADMNGPETAKHFKTFGPPNYLKTISEFRQKFPGEILSGGTTHDASLIVALLAYKELAAKAKQLNVPFEVYRNIFHGKYGFLGSETGSSNSSGSTTPLKLQYLVENRLIKPNGFLFFGAPGIGSIIASAVVECVRS